MVIWRGWGWLVLFLIIGVMFFGWQLFPPIWKAFSGYEYAYNGEQGVGWGIGWILAAGILFVFNRFVLLKLETIPVTGDGWQARAAAKKAAEARGETFVVPQHTKPYSSFFFIPLRWLVFVFLGIGVIVLAINIPAAIENLAEHERVEQLAD